MVWTYDAGNRSLDDFQVSGLRNQVDEAGYNGRKTHLRRKHLVWVALSFLCL